MVEWLAAPAGQQVVAEIVGMDALHRHDDRHPLMRQARAEGVHVARVDELALDVRAGVIGLQRIVDVHRPGEALVRLAGKEVAELVLHLLDGELDIMVGQSAVTWQLIHVAGTEAGDGAAGRRGLEGATLRRAPEALRTRVRTQEARPHLPVLGQLHHIDDLARVEVHQLSAVGAVQEPAARVEGEAPGHEHDHRLQGLGVPRRLVDQQPVTFAGHHLVEGAVDQLVMAPHPEGLALHRLEHEASEVVLAVLAGELDDRDLLVRQALKEAAVLVHLGDEVLEQRNCRCLVDLVDDLSLGRCALQPEELVPIGEHAQILGDLLERRVLVPEPHAVEVFHLRVPLPRERTAVRLRIELIVSLPR
jgi:hypothetical protein